MATTDDEDYFDTSKSKMDRVINNKLLMYIERVERVNEEIKGLQDDRKDIFSEAKGDGFDSKIMRAIIILRKMDKNDRVEMESLIETYKEAVGLS